MLSSPVALPFQACSSQAASSEFVVAEFHNLRKRKLNVPGTDSFKRSIMENEVKKVEILEATESKMDKFTESTSCKMDHKASL